MDIYQVVTKFYQNCKLPKRIYGKSVFGRNLYAIKIGDGLPVGIAQYAIHGREYVTAKLALHHCKIKVKGSVWILPLTNPDGALLSQVGLQSVKSARVKNKLIAMQNGNENFSLWKANGRGVDLNVNFDADWGTGAKNTRFAGAENYIGKKPFSERESKALKKFTLKIKPNYTVSYHTKGEEIYWHFHQPTENLERDKRLGEALSKATGYPLVEAGNSAGGYKDWCIQALKIPAYTIEVGKDSFSHPLVEETIYDIIQKNGNALKRLSKEYTLL